MKTGKYIGSDRRLRGKTAFIIDNPLRIRCDPPSVKTDEQSVLIQAYDVSTGLGHGWHEFPAEDWEIKIL